MPSTPQDLHPGQEKELSITRMAHGGEGIALLDGRVVFVRGAYPGDVLKAEITRVKKNFARAEIREVIQDSEMRVPQRCPATAAGAGCCDFGDLDPTREAQLKKEILADQVGRLARGIHRPPIEVIDLTPKDGWRTRVRLGVADSGLAGFRAPKSTDIITGYSCAQISDEVCGDILAPDGRRFEPGTEIIIALDSQGQRHIVESRKAPRGRRVEKVERVVEGSGVARQQVMAKTFDVPATAFWQAHMNAAGCYSGLLYTWLLEEVEDLAIRGPHPVAWDLYGGVGLFVPVLGEVLGRDTSIHSVELSPSARCPQPGLADYQVTFHNTRVEKAVSTLQKPDVVVLDPPRTGAGKDVVNKVAASRPQLVIHIGCDPATFARDMKTWAENGYRMRRMTMVNAFPGTHHFEILSLFDREN
ncbi:TRAM domain-containing protein [Corynebacterium sp. 3HC-13]|uniref:class I SAM-dependent RNA methyltransferase n=1 Tax=Corynebacterium poyangense TaxID=2684405 RepID=UPI001CCDF9FB|nr:TRAM domain-containing protein [Corynebacterium poyangense]MBZ8177922.1 TRAM domain-containing protein [Corynebacterium poyangense]